MKRTVWIWQLCGFAFTSLGGTLLHFLFEFTGGSLLAAPFSGVNESTWEHMKLLFFPMLAYAVFQYFFFSDRRDFWCIKLCGICTGLILIPLIFYMYNGIIGKSPDFINIAIFFISAAIAYITETYLFSKGIECKKPYRPLLILAGIAAMFVVFTFFVPRIALFMDPVTGEYGIPFGK